MKEESGKLRPKSPNDLVEIRREAALEGGGSERQEAQRARGKLTVRERLDLLLDPGSFHEINLHMLHRHTQAGLNRRKVPGDSLVAGFGKVNGRRVCVMAQDFTVMGGSFSEVAGQKATKVMQLALDAGVPVISLNDSVGARIQEGVYSLAAYSNLFWSNTQASGVVPQISVMLGPCAGGSVYSPGLTDFVIMTEGSSYMFITGPDVIRTVTSEQVDKEGLGGARIHATRSGVAHLIGRDERESLELTKALLGYLPSNNADRPPALQPADDPHRQDFSLDSLVPDDPTEPYDMKDVLQSVTDRDTFFEIHPYFAQNSIVGFARLHGQVVGLVAQQPMVLAGVLDVDAADKIARFIRFCDAFNIPLITFVDSPGFLPGVAQEHSGIIRHGAKIVYSYSEATVPKISVVTRKAFGGAYIVMGSKYIGTDLVYAWPSAEIAVMGPEGVARIVYEERLQAMGEKADEARRRLVELLRAEAFGPFAAAESGHVDDVILPHETRSKLIAALELLRDKSQTRRPRKHGTMPL